MKPELKRPITPPLPDFESRNLNGEYPTPSRAGLKAIIAWEHYNGRDPNQLDIMRFLDINKTQGYEIIKSDTTRTHGSVFKNNNPRGRPYALSNEKADEIADLLDNEGFDAATLNWQQLGTEVGVDAHYQSIQLVMNKRHQIYDGIAAEKELVDEKTAERRVARATYDLKKYPTWENWKHVRWSDEVHFGWSDEGKLHLKRRRGHRYNPLLIQHPREPRDKDRKRFHCWAAIGYNFKSEIYFYDISTNTNGKMSQKEYINQILEPIVKPWLERGDDFVLEEDGDSGHGPGRSNPVRDWKATNGLKSYFNCASSPDLSIIENAWQTPKDHLRKYPVWNDEDTKKLIIEGWAKLKQESINDWVRTYPQRLQDVITANGQMTGW